MEKTTGKPHKRLNHGNELPPELAYIWQWFLEVHSENRLSYTELSSWAQTTGIKLQGWETGIIMKLERLYYEVNNGN